MPLEIPMLDDRRYQDLLNEALARIPVHNPEWTNFNRSDPGVTLLEIFAFLTENLLYRANQIPERNRKKFLSLLGVGLRPATPARGIVGFNNARGPRETITLPRDLELKAGQTPFFTAQGLDVLPVEAQVYFKKPTENPNEDLLNAYKQLYASYFGQEPNDEQVKIYQTTPALSDTSAVNTGETVDSSLWIALLAHDKDKKNLDVVRKAIAGKILNIGFVPWSSKASKDILIQQPDQQSDQQLDQQSDQQPNQQVKLSFELPKVAQGSGVPLENSIPKPEYFPLEHSQVETWSEPKVLEVKLPPNIDQLRTWEGFDPLEAGVGDLPPPIEDSVIAQRLITWLRIRFEENMSLLGVFINAAVVRQQAKVTNEILPIGTGEPDQTAKLSKVPVISGSVRITVTPPNQQSQVQVWQQIEDMQAAGPEVPVNDPQYPPGTPPPKPKPNKVFILDAESGQIRFGDGFHGQRPARGSIIRADYTYSVGRDGNVAAGAIKAGPTLPSGLEVGNPVRTWGGANAQSTHEGEKRITHYLQHRDRLVNKTDFEMLTMQTPSVEVGRVEVIPSSRPTDVEVVQSSRFVNRGGEITPHSGGVTVMVIPEYDVKHPDAPEPDQLFLDAVCKHLEPRRLITTEVYLRGPTYKRIWISISIKVVAGQAQATVREAVKAQLKKFLSPLPPAQRRSLQSLEEMTIPLTTSPKIKPNGWQLERPVIALELLAEASRAPGVQFVNKVLLAEDTGDEVSQVSFSGLELPRIGAIAVSTGNSDPLSIQAIRDAVVAEPSESPFLPLPIIPEDCK